MQLWNNINNSIITTCIPGRMISYYSKWLPGPVLEIRYIF
jgi:hypothetical protein